MNREQNKQNVKRKQWCCEADVLFCFVSLRPEDGGGSEQTDRSAGGENQAAAKQTGEAESAPASTAEQGQCTFIWNIYLLLKYWGDERGDDL